MVTKKGKPQKLVSKTNTTAKASEEHYAKTPREHYKPNILPEPAPAPYVPLLKKFIAQGESYINEFEASYAAFAPYISDFRRHEETMEYLQGELSACSRLKADEAAKIYQDLCDARFEEQSDAVLARIVMSREGNFAQRKQTLEDALNNPLLVTLSDKAYDVHQREALGKIEKPALLIDQFQNEYHKEVKAFGESQEKAEASIKTVLASKGKLDDVFSELMTYTTSNPRDETLKGLRNAKGYDGLTEAIATQTEKELKEYYTLAEKMIAKIQKLEAYPLPGYALKKPAELPVTETKTETLLEEASTSKYNNPATREDIPNALGKEEMTKRQSEKTKGDEGIFKKVERI